MNMFLHWPGFPYILTLCAALCAAMLALEFTRIVWRKPSPSYPWMAYATAMLMASIACNRVLLLLQPDSIGGANFIAQFVPDILLLFAAALIPAVRVSTYKRPGLSQLEALNEQLRYSKELFAGFMNEVPMAVFLKDSERRFLFANRALCQYLNIDLQDLIGKIEILKTEEEQAKSRQEDQLVWQSNKTLELRKTFPFGDDEVHTLVIKFPLVSQFSQRMLGGIIVDITEQALRKARIDFLASIVELSPDAIYSYDEAGTVLSWNTAAERMLGFTRDEIIGKCIDIAVPDDKLQERREFTAQLASGGITALNLETTRKAKDGTVKNVWISAVLTPAYGEHETVCALIVRDITKRKATEREIKKLNEVLKWRIEELSQANAELQQASDQAVKANACKSAFIASITHELRTPLAGVLGMSELILRQDLPESARQLMSLTYDSSQTLSHVINEILDFSTIEAGKANIEKAPFELRPILHECIAAIEPAAIAKRLNVQLDIDERIPAAVCGDKVCVRGVLIHLLENAIKFTEQGRINVSVAVESIGDTNVDIKFCVQDSGIGIPPATLPSLFTPFSEIAQPSLGLTDTGLGLVLSKRMVELMGGTISVESAVGQGSSFCVRLSFAKSDSSECTAVVHLGRTKLSELPIPISDLARTNILIVEDNLVLSRLTLCQLNVLGIVGASANSGAAALTYVKKSEFDLILIDLHLPDLSGFDVAKQIRAFERRQGRRKSVLVALTGSGMASDREKAKESEMDDYLVKPINIEQLKKMIQYWMTQSRTA